tara:strand:- start:6723 stop:7643 length:921 start_codon:yes stop_codon:yes gene_type:complete
MTDNQKHNNDKYVEDEVNIIKILQDLWENKLIIIISTSIFSILAVLYSLSLPNIYDSKTLLSPVVPEGGAVQSASSISGLASIAGIDVTSKSSSNSAKALKKITSLSFFKDNILPNIFLPDLMAVDYWDDVTNTIMYKSNYDQETDSWNEIPSVQQSYKVFLSVLNVYEDNNTGFVTISTSHQSPFISQAWTELVVNQLNNYFRMYDKKEAELSMNFLNNQMAQTSFTEIKQVIAFLLKEKMQLLALIEANESYVFSYIDPPMVMEEKLAPNRRSISILGFVFGAMLGILISLLKRYYIDKKNQAI